MAQTRRAWFVLSMAFAAFAIILVSGVATGVWVYRHATVPQRASLQVISGNGALIRSPDDPDWRLVTSETAVREGDRVSTAIGAVVRLAMFDGSTVEVAEDTVVEVVRMRSSRFLRRTKLVVLEPERGAVYVSMEPRGRYRFSEFIVRHGQTRVSMTDEPASAAAGSFLIEVRGLAGSPPEVRAAVLRGEAWLTTPTGKLRLAEKEQTIVSAAGEIGEIGAAVRELIENGSFARGLDGWVTFSDQGHRPGASVASSASVELVAEQTPSGDAVAVEFLRAPADATLNQTGIRQRIGKTVRPHASLQLAFEARISEQQPLGGGEQNERFPLTIQLNYVDIDGQERQWWHGYYALPDPANTAPDERATQLDRDEWRRVVMDLRNLVPPPRHVTSIVVYASGHSYQTRVANISLTTSELVEPGR